MFNFIIHSTKALLAGLWILAILGMISISPLPAEYQWYLLVLAGVVLVVHLLEYFALKAKVKHKSNTDISFTQTMLWGFGHWLPLLNKSIEK